MNINRGSFPLVINIEMKLFIITCCEVYCCSSFNDACFVIFCFVSLLIPFKKNKNKKKTLHFLPVENGMSPIYLFTSVALLNCVVHCCHKLVFSPPPPLGITFYICDQKEPQCLNWDAVTTAISIIVSFLLFYDDIDIQPLLGHPNPMGSFFAIFDLLRKEDAFFFFLSWKCYVHTELFSCQ